MVQQRFVHFFYVSAIATALACPCLGFSQIAIPTHDSLSVVNQVQVVSAKSPIDPNADHKVTAHAPHEVKIIDTGSAALEARLRLIENAKESIYIEAYLFHNDASGRLILQALRKKAKELGPHKIKILIDHGSLGPDFSPELMAELQHWGIDVKIYNPTGCIPSKLNYFKQLYDCNHRNHRKILLVDGKEVITGGRNFGDEYFGFNDKGTWFGFGKSINYKDRDIHIRGEIAKTVEKSFFEYWDSPLAAAPSKPKPEPQDTGLLGLRRAQLKHDEKIIAAKDTLVPNAADKKLRERVRKQGSKELAEERFYTLKKALYIWDRPGTEIKDHFTAHAIMEKMNDAQTLDMETAYFIPTEKEKKLFEEIMAKKDGRISVKTNAFSAADVRVTAWIAYMKYRRLIKAGMQTNLLNKNSGLDPNLIDAKKLKDSRVGTHAKTLVKDEKHSYIGSMNMDGRSKRWSSELMIGFEDDTAFANRLLKKMQDRFAVSTSVDKNEVLYGIDATIHSELGYVEGAVVKVGEKTLPDFIAELF